MKTHKTMLKNQSVFSYPWVARIFWIRPCRFRIRAILPMLVLLLVLPAAAYSYLIPVEQLLRFTVKRIHRSKTIVITRSVHCIDPTSKEIQAVFEDRICLDRPDLYYLEITKAPAGNTSPDLTDSERGKDLFFYLLFLTKNTDDLTRFLSDLCINLKTESFSRLDKTIVYRIGDTEQNAPYIMIDKDRFLPLLLCYYNDSDRNEKVVVRFSDYKKIGKRWFPLEITYRKEGSVVKRYIHTDIKHGNKMVIGYPLTEMPKLPCQKITFHP
ncbi:MAG: hypothetical protein B1H11_09340 [Desulfobacteraceae bacterium 4484_190.1]|nr:MAG: hypothetical protein B1H11_09340 [Desulfobacteraceae bacterium 4484_190.1]